MKSWLGFVLVLAAAAVIAVVWLAVRAPEAPVSSAAVAPSEVVALESEVARLRDELHRLRSAGGRGVPEHGAPMLIEPSATSPAVTEGSLATPAVESARSPAKPPRPSDPDGYLDEYIASVQARAESEHYRHLVAAYVIELAPRISALIRDWNSPITLRLRLMTIFADPRLHGHSQAVDALVDVLRTSREERLVARALASLKSIGDPSAAAGIEPFVWSMPTPGLGRVAIETVLSLAAERRNESLRRLLSSAPDKGMRGYLISLLDPDRPIGALSVFELASTLEPMTRLQAAHKIGGFMDPVVTAFVPRWLDVETDPAVRSVLENTVRTGGVTPSWHARQAIGEPDANPGDDDPKAWASANGDMGEQWIELGYTPARRCNLVRIHEVNSAGAVVAVVAIEESGAEHTLWAGVDSLRHPGVFEIEVPATSYAVRRLRVVLDTDVTPGWNEIDCVELVGPDGRAWASEARASSWFGGR